MKEYYQKFEIAHLDKSKSRNSLKDSFITLHLNQKAEESEKTELEMVQQSKEIELEEIWEEMEGQSKRRILIVGNAGMGKSILSERICQEWSQKQLWKEREYELLILVSLKEVISLGCNNLFEFTLQKYLKTKKEEETATIRLELIELNKSKKILWIVDGLDELEMMISQKQNNLAKKLLESLNDCELFSEMVITSRPEIGETIFEITLNLEIKGFEKRKKKKNLQKKFIRHLFFFCSFSFFIKK